MCVHACVGVHACVACMRVCFGRLWDVWLLWVFLTCLFESFRPLRVPFHITLCFIFQFNVQSLSIRETVKAINILHFTNAFISALYSLFYSYSHTYTQYALWQVISLQSSIARWKEQMLNIELIWAEYQQLSRSNNTDEQCDGSNDTALRQCFSKTGSVPKGLN